MSHGVVTEQDRLAPILEGKGFHYSREPVPQIPVDGVLVMVAKAQDLGSCWALIHESRKPILLLVYYISQVNEDVLWVEPLQPFQRQCCMVRGPDSTPDYARGILWCIEVGVRDHPYVWLFHFYGVVSVKRLTAFVVVISSYSIIHFFFSVFLTCLLMDKGQRF